MSTTKEQRSAAEAEAEAIVQRALGTSEGEGYTSLQVNLALKSVKSSAMRQVVLVRR